MLPWFVFFLISGCCGLVYELIWLRLAMAQFGVTSPSLSILLSVFMGGLALGAWLVARFRSRLDGLDAAGAVRLYALVEAAIAVLALPVPWLMRAGGELLAAALVGQGPVAWYAGALAWQLLILLPACTALGATIPIGMLAIAKARLPGASSSFSLLYLANVLGAVVGTLLPAFVLIELLGFSRTLLLAGAANLTIAALASAHARRVALSAARAPVDAALAPTTGARQPVLALLFFTGFCSMGVEVVWTRQFTPFLGTVVYAFAVILATYLAATFLGSAVYRRLGARAPSPLQPAVWGAIVAAGVLTLVATDVQHLPVYSWLTSSVAELACNVLRVVIGVAPLSFALGFVTPQLVDRYSAGVAARAGVAYAVNTVGCIAGPLVAGFVLLPRCSDRHSLLLLLLPFAAAVAIHLRGASWWRWAGLVPATLVLALLTAWPRSFDETFPAAQIRRDHTATTIASGHGMDRRLLVNGVGMTVLTPLTKVMAHLPMAVLPRPPRNVLVVCFGMGTSFRSALSWEVPTTAVELVPGVVELFAFFHEDAPQVLASRHARVVVDDGRRFLVTTTESYDVIVIDPPPPVSAASSSLLYSVEFYDLVKRRLAPGGILQQWIPGGDDITVAALTRALVDSFPHVVALRGLTQGIHLLASERPLRVPTAAELAAALPPRAAADLVEWGPFATPTAQFDAVLRRRLPPPAQWLATQYPTTPALEDDHPVNEYFLLRQLRSAAPGGA